MSNLPKGRKWITLSLCVFAVKYIETMRDNIRQIISSAFGINADEVKNEWVDEYIHLWSNNYR